MRLRLREREEERNTDMIDSNSSCFPDGWVAAYSRTECSRQHVRTLANALRFLNELTSLANRAGRDAMT